MKTETALKLSFVVIFISILFGSFGTSPAQTGKWVSYVDPSMISEIALHQDELYLATTGGLLIYRPGDSSFEQFTNTAGLPSNYLTCLLFDRRGRLWIGTETSGVARLDPLAGGFDVTPLSSTFHGLSDDRITDLAEWGDTLVYTTKKGMGLIIKDFPGPRFFERDGLPSELVHAVLPDGDHVWVATDEGLVVLDKFGFIQNPTDTSFACYAIEKTDTALWVGTDTGIAYLKQGTEDWVHTQLETDPRPVFSLAYDRAGGKLWAGARARFYWYDGSVWKKNDIFGLYGTHALNNRICELRGLRPMPDGTLFVGGGDPVSQRRGVHLVHFNGTDKTQIPFNGIIMNGLLRLNFDIDESLWISTANFGVAKFTPEGDWFAYNSVTGDTDMTSRFNLSLLADSQGSKWFCTLSYPANPKPIDELDDGLDTDYENDVWAHYGIGDGGGDGLGSVRNQDATEDPVGNRWFLSDEDAEHAPGWWGINILSRDKSAWRQINPVTTDPSGQLGGMKAGNVTDVAFGEGGLVYVGLKGYGVQLWVTGGLDQDNLFDLTDDNWLTIAKVGDRNGIESGASILSLALRDDGVLWIGTDAGVYRYQSGSLIHIAANRGFGTGLLGTNVNDLVLDRGDNLWVGTDLGLNRIASDNINDIASYTTPIVWQTQLSLFFPPTAVSPIVDAYCERLALHPTEDLLYIATRNGLSKLDIAALESRETDLSKVYVYPNPVRSARGHTSLKIANINTEILVEIYTLEGELVHTQRVSESEEEVWDLTTKTGFLASSGVYMVRITGPEGTVVKNVSLIR